MNLALFGDTEGIEQLLKYLPKNNIKLLVGSYTRTNYFNELKSLSEINSIPFIVQPKYNTLEFNEFLNKFETFKIDLIWSNSYTILIRDEILNLTKLGGVNIHASYLPLNRGSNPIQWSIINNNNFTGVTLHRIEKTIDTGEIIDQIKIPILIEDTWISLKRKIINNIEIIIRKNCNDILKENINSRPQNEAIATQNNRRNIDEGLFEWDEEIIKIYNKIRALVKPLHGAFYIHQGKNIFFKDVKSINELLQLKFSPKSPVYRKSIFEGFDFTIKKINNLNEDILKNLFSEKKYKFSYKLLKNLNFNFIYNGKKLIKGSFSIYSICWESKKCILYVAFENVLIEKDALRTLYIISRFIHKELNLNLFIIFLKNNFLNINNNKYKEISTFSENITKEFRLFCKDQYLNINIKI